METEKKYNELINIAKELMENIEDKEHDMNHVNDVVNYTKELLNSLDIKVNYDVCIIAAYWHDVGRTKLNDGHEKLSAEMLKSRMFKMNYEASFIDSCYQAIKYHKWNMLPKTVEGWVLKDADKLAYLGKERWKSCLENNKKLDEIMLLLPRLKDEILHFEESKKIYDRKIIDIVKLLYDKYYFKKLDS